MEPPEQRSAFREAIDLSSLDFRRENSLVNPEGGPIAWAVKIFSEAK